MKRSNTSKKILADIIITGARQVLTCASDASDLVGCIEGGVVAIAGDRIVAVGTPGEVLATVEDEKAEVVDAQDGLVLPGFVDCHTHVVFAGSRVEEYVAKLRGATAKEMSELGIPAGILATVGMVRGASKEEIVQSTNDRLNQMLNFGTTTVESKSGYGLSTEAEIRLLEVNRRLNETQPIEIVSTFLGAHDFPSKERREDYLNEIINEMIPVVKENNLAEFIDVYCDDGFYSVEESRQILQAGIEAGLKAKIHTDAYSHIGGSRLAAELGVVSADHLNYIDDVETQLLTDRGIVGVLMPALDFAVGHPHPFQARPLLDHGMTVALATDACPGCWVESMPFVIQLACRLYQFTPEEALRASTFGAACAVNREKRIGSLESGKQADIIILDLPRYEDLVYRLGRNPVKKVIKSGTVVLDKQ